MKIEAVRQAGESGSTVWIEIVTQAGVTGVAPCASYHAERACMLGSSFLPGEDARAASSLYECLHLAGGAEHSGPAIAALDIALWDAKAKGECVPLWRCLGGTGSAVRLLSTQGEAFGGIVQLVGDAVQDLEAVETIHSELSCRHVEPVLFLRLGEGWEAQSSVAHIQTIERKFDVSFVESPAPDQDVSGHLAVGEAVRAAVCNGRGFSSVAQFSPHLKARSLDAVLVDIHALGITGALQVADAAYMYELPVIATASVGNIVAHLAGAIPYFAYLEASEEIPAGEGAAHVADGMARPGEASGHGLGGMP